MIHIGLDPGYSGAIVALDGDKPPAMIRGDETERDIWDWLQGFQFNGDGQRVFALLERVHSMPKQGVSSSFKFGTSYGFLRGLLIASGIPFEETTPQAWQKAMGCMSKGDKNRTKAKAQELFPSVKCSHWNSDALLLALYCRRIHGNTGT